MLRCLPLALLPLAVVCGQTTANRLEFEVASIKPSAPLTAGPNVNVGVHIDGAQVRCNSLTLRDYIGMAYNLKLHQIQGPDWIMSERWDIAAKVPEGGKDNIREMMQTLLADRFQMKVHRDKKDFPVYALVVAKTGLKLKESAPDAAAEDAAPGRGGAVNVSASGGRGGTTVNFGNGSSFSVANNKLIGKKLTMAALAESLGRFTDRPIVDATELTANYDFELEFTPEDFRAMIIRSAIAAGITLPAEAMRLLEASGDSLFNAVQTVGLRLDSRKAPIDVLVVDSVLRSPTEN